MKASANKTLPLIFAIAALRGCTVEWNKEPVITCKDQAHPSGEFCSSVGPNLQLNARGDLFNGFVSVGVEKGNVLYLGWGKYENQ